MWWLLRKQTSNVVAAKEAELAALQLCLYETETRLQASEHAYSLIVNMAYDLVGGNREVAAPSKDIESLSTENRVSQRCDEWFSVEDVSRNRVSQSCD